MFSDTVQLADINDFITPEQECIIQTGGNSNVKLDDDALMDDIGTVKLQAKKSDPFGHFNQMITDESTKTARITLDDCLACSGCITSAETVLIQQQSTQQMIAHLQTHENSTLIVTISNQALIAIAKKYNLDTTVASLKIAAFFKQEYHAKFVLNTSVALELAMKEATHEFTTLYRQKYITSSFDEAKMDNMDMDIDEGITHSSRKLPVLSSECPGFICYAEKSCKASVLDYISAMKSPQQLMGVLLKKYWFSAINQQCDGCMSDASQIYHVTVMPCYDKKLEASRKEFILDQNSSMKEVDCVITSLEIEQLLMDKQIDNLGTYPVQNQECMGGSTGDDDMLRWLQGLPGLQVGNTVHQQQYRSEVIIDTKGSYAYLENVFIVAAQQLFNVELKSTDLRYKKLRNEDIEEVTLTLSPQRMSALPFKFKDPNILRTGKVLHFLRCFGFRNIQNIVRKIEKHKSKYHYVEIMACPSGCLNGGGQIRMESDAVDSKRAATQRKHIEDMRQRWHELQMIQRIDQKYSPHMKSTSIADAVYTQLLKCQVGENESFRTTYHNVHDADNSNNSKLNIAW